MQVSKKGCVFVAAIRVNFSFSTDTRDQVLLAAHSWQV